MALGLKLLESELKDALAALEAHTNGSAIGDVAQAGLQQVLGTMAAQLERFNSWLELTDDISKNNFNAIAVLNDLLNYDKIEMGTMQLDKKPTNLWVLPKKVMKAFEIQAKQAGVTLQVDMELDQDIQPEYRNKLRRLRVDGDELRLTQVFRNLISNALKFTPPGGSVTVTGIQLYTEYVFFSHRFCSCDFLLLERLS